MPRCQSRRALSKKEHFTTPTPNSPSNDHQGRLEAWVKGNEDKIQVFPIEMTRKQINISKIVRLSWLKAENFDDSQRQLKH